MKSFSLAMLLVGTIIGAGFASGREILSFFNGEISFFIPILCGIFIFLASVLFLSVGKKIKATTVSEVNNRVLGKIHVAADIFLLFNCLVVLSGMLSASDSLFSMILPIAPAYSLIFGGICALIVAKGLKGLLKSNLIIAPLLIVAIVIVCCFTTESPTFSGSFRWFTLPSALLYVSMNMMLASTVFTTVKDVNFKQIILSSAIAAATIATLMLLIILALDGQGGALPLLEVAKSQSKPLFYISIVAVGASIFTTILTSMNGLCTWLKGLIGSTKFSVLLVLMSGLLLSNIGFENVVSFIYPIIGVLGGLYILMCAIFLFRSHFNAPQNSMTMLKNSPTTPKNSLISPKNSRAIPVNNIKTCKATKKISSQTKALYQ